MVAFESADELSLNNYEVILNKVHDEQVKAFGHLNEGFPSGIVLPQFVGSLTSEFVFAPPNGGWPMDGLDYHAYKSVHKSKNIALQALLCFLIEAIWDYGQRKPPFAFPDDLSPIGTIGVRANRNRTQSTK